MTGVNRDRGVDDESAPRACSVCGKPLLDEYLTLVRQPSGHTEGRLCTDCADGVRGVVLDLDKIFVAIDRKLLPDQVNDACKVAQKVLRPVMSHPSWGYLRFIPIEAGDKPDECIVRLDGHCYRWSRLRESLDRLGG